MARPLRIAFEGAICHVTSRGDRREPIYRDDADRAAHLDVIAQAMDRFDAEVQAHARWAITTTWWCAPGKPTSRG
jgi:hypothetical protein